MGIGLCTGRKCSYKSHRTQDIRHFLISSKTNPYSRADYPPASPSATYFKREHLPISLLCSSLIAPGFSNLPHNLTTLSYERLHSSEKRILFTFPYSTIQGWRVSVQRKNGGSKSYIKVLKGLIMHISLSMSP